MKPIFSFTLQELIDNRDGDFIHHDSYTSKLSEPEIKYVYANTIVLSVKSAHYGEQVDMGKGKKGTNNTIYTVYVLMEDFYTIGKDKDIEFEDAIDYALNYGDVHIRCNCPAFLYWGYAYIGTQLRYLYGIPRENRFPKVRNPNVRGTICKHSDIAIQYCLKNKSLLAKMFAAYYDRLKPNQSIYAVNANGTTITIGHKEGDGDIFFEQIEQEIEEMEDAKMATQNNVDDEELVWDDTIDPMEPDTWWSDEDNVISEEE